MASEFNRSVAGFKTRGAMIMVSFVEQPSRISFVSFRAISFVGAVRAIRFTITSPGLGNASIVLASEPTIRVATGRIAC